ncbi:hypothetical protein WA158_001810 [Blastocystis sp. Blastoise]
MVKTPLEFLSKKKWNPGNRNNREAVWIREQEKAAEEKKIKELQKKIKDERQLMEITAIHDRNIEDDKKECVEWMYTYKREGPTDEDYLTGKAAVDFDKDDKNTFSKLEDGSIAGASIANAPVVSSETEAFRRVHEDPLLEMKRKEIEMRKKLLENPRRKKQLMEPYIYLSKQLGKPVGISTSTADMLKSSENDKHSKTSYSSKSNSERDHHHHSRDYRSKNHKKSSSSSSPSRENDDSDIDIDKKKENNTIQKRSEYRDNRVDSKRRHSRHRSNSNRRRSRSNSRHSRYRSRSNSRHNNNKNSNTRDTYETRKIDDSHKNSNTYTKDRNNKKDKQLTEEEVQKRLNEMKQDASVNQDLRYKRLLENHKKDIKETEEEEELKKNYDENNNYLQSFKKDAYLGNDASLSDRIKSRTFYQQK